MHHVQAVQHLHSIVLTGVRTGLTDSGLVEDMELRTLNDTAALGRRTGESATNRWISPRALSGHAHGKTRNHSQGGAGNYLC